MSIKAGRVGVNPSQVNPVDGSIISSATSGYTKQEADAKFETQTHAASTYETKTDAAALQSIQLNVPIELLSGSVLTVPEALNGISELTEELTPSGYDTDGLSYSNCNYVAGGYVKIGRLVFVNIRVTSLDTNEFAISGFPAYSDLPTGRNVVPVNAFNMTDDSDTSYYSALSAAGVLSIKGSIIASKEYAFSATYLCN